MSRCMRLSAVRQIQAQTWLPYKPVALGSIRHLHVDGRSRLSNEWVPSGGIAASADEDAHAKLIRAGLIRQSHSGIFQLLPLGLRVQEKLTRLVDHRMRGLGASRVQLSAITSAQLWEKSGRLQKIGSELFRFQDRKEVDCLLGPTHEEEITTLVARSVQSYKNLPLRVYQITQKYRDELRPRHGLLRGRDFCMKDLYTFDLSVDAALQTYEEVRAAYFKIFTEDLKLPIIVGKASSGDMGGDLSHEYHIPTAFGEDNVISCNSCDYAANEEVARSRVGELTQPVNIDQVSVWRGISKDRKTLVNVWYIPDENSQDSPINIHAVKDVIPELDAGLEDARPLWLASLENSTENVHLTNWMDVRIPGGLRQEIMCSTSIHIPVECGPYRGRIIYTKKAPSDEQKDFLRIQSGASCPSCETGTLTVQKAIELGHTFHLGTRYSEPLNAKVTGPAEKFESSNGDGQPLNDKTGGTPVSMDKEPRSSGSSAFTHKFETVPVYMQMGCHGIGISRIIGAVANHLVDRRGLNWPRVIAPYEAAVLYNGDNEGLAKDAAMVHDVLVGASKSNAGSQQPQVDTIIDDRSAQLGWKLKDADLVGYPVLVVLGREWKTSERLEVQCRRLQFKEAVSIQDLQSCVEGLLQKL